MATDQFKDYYQALGVERSATAEQIKRAYRKLARKYHPDVSKEPDAENQFKAVAEAHEALIDPERRAAYDDLAARHARGETGPQPGWDGYEFSGRGTGAGRGGNGAGGHDASDAEFSDFFESLFGRGGAAGSAPRGTSSRGRSPGGAYAGSDHHARIEIDLADAFTGARHTVSLRRPVIDAQGRAAVHDRQLEVSIPPGVRPGQHLRLAGLGEPGEGGGPAGDLFLEIAFRPHARFRVDGADLWFDLPVAPWEAALGATVGVATPVAELQLNIPAGSTAGRKLRLKGKGLPGKTPGDLYAVLQVALPPADSEASRSAYTALAQAFAGFEPRSHGAQTAPAA